ncbi:MAG: VanZ family protein [Chitinophagales bacterium]|nr:VanZ family protein [Chitinophagales bacterium]
MFLKNYLPALVWALFIFLLSMLPGKFIAPANIWDIVNFDKLGHLFVFFVLMVFSLRGLSKQIRSAPAFRFMLFTFLICSAYGFLIEVMQGTLSNDRQFDIYDGIANMLGCLLGGIVFKYVRAIITR